MWYPCLQLNITGLLVIALLALGHYDAQIWKWIRTLIRESGIQLLTFENLGHKYGYECPNFFFRSLLN